MRLTRGWVVDRFFIPTARPVAPSQTVDLLFIVGNIAEAHMDALASLP